MRFIKAASYAQEAARYLYFVVKNDGKIWSGWEFKEDAKDDLKEMSESNPGSKILPRSKVDPKELADFWKKAGVTDKMAKEGEKKAREGQS